MDTAPGSDSFMPHDLQHLIVEQEFGLSHAIFGQLSEGGDAATFRQTKTINSKRKAERQRRAAKKRSQTLAAKGNDESAQSERATIVCLHKWMSDSNDKELLNRAAEIEDIAQSTLSLMSKEERARYTSESLRKISRRMDVLSRQWIETPIGKSMEVKW